jgi:hypothetical protein
MIPETVLSRLREAGFQADMAFPGGKCPEISGPVAAVHLEKVDRADMTATVEVSIHTPAALGGARCEAEALRAMEVLHQAGGTCVQNGCVFNGLTKTYSVSIRAAFSGVGGTENADFRVYIGDGEQIYALKFHSEQITDTETVPQIGEDAPAGIRQGSPRWEFTLEELIPPGIPEPAGTSGSFQLRLERGNGKETYRGCLWTNIRREFTGRGLRRIRSGISLDRQEG